MAMAYEDGRAKLLMTLPGVAHGVAMSLLAAFGDIARFKDGDHAASYLGLTPSLRQSAAKRYHGRITKAGCPQTRAMLVQAGRRRHRIIPARSEPSSGGCENGRITTWP